MYIPANSVSAVWTSMMGAWDSGGRSLRTWATLVWIWVRAAFVS